MHNIHDLEKRWLRYKIKSFIPHVLISLMVIISSTLLLSIYTKKSTLFTTQNIVLNAEMQQPISKKIISKVEVVPIEKIALPVIIPPVVQTTKKVVVKPIIIQENTKITLSPSMDFIKNLRSSSTNSYKSNSFKSKKPQYVQERYNEEEELEIEERKVQKKKSIIVHKEKKVLIQRQESQSDINHVIARFQKNNNPALSLFIAKKYYKLGDYKQAYNYALLTNQINKSIDQSWIIFARSLVKLNKKEKAKSILKSYIKSSKSVNAKVLLDDIKSGKFK